MATCPHCGAEVFGGAYACALCGRAFLPPPRRSPSRRAVGCCAAIGLVAGSCLGLRYGGFGACAGVPMGAFLGFWLGATVGAAWALAVRRRFP